MPSGPTPKLGDLCPACRQLTPDRRGHTFLVPQKRDGAAGYFSCLECGALWLPVSEGEARTWNLVRIEPKDGGED